MVQRIFVAGIWHETNTFSAVPTGLDAFHRYQYAEGEEMFERYAGTNTEIGGMIRAAVPDLSLLPGVFAGAVPSGLVSAEAFDAIRTKTLAHLQAAGDIDGCLLALHGAFVAENDDDGDAAFAEALRASLAPDLPVAATFDLHANLSRRLVDCCDLMIGYKTYPHHDMGLCGEQAAAGLRRIIGEGRKPATAFRKLPFAPPAQVQVTDDEPAASIMDLVRAREARDDVWSVSVAWGFPYADIADLGVGVLVYADEQGPADAIAEEIAAEIWRRRREFKPRLVSVEDALRQLVSGSEGPAMLVEVADNTGGGSPGDATPVLRALLDQAVEGAVIVMWDPAAVAVAFEAGIGGVFEGPVGGKADDLHGAPVAVSGKVEFAEQVRYRRRGNYMTGQEVDLGRVAVINAGGVRVVLTTEKAMPFDNDHLRAVGILPEQASAIVVKSAIAWRAHFQSFAGAEYYLDTPGIATSNLTRFDYKKALRPLYPLDDDASWPP